MRACQLVGGTNGLPHRNCENFLKQQGPKMLQRNGCSTRSLCMGMMLWTFADMWGSLNVVPKVSAGELQNAQSPSCRFSGLGWVAPALLPRGQCRGAFSTNSMQLLARRTCGRQQSRHFPVVAMDQEGGAGRDEAMQEKLKKWREQAEAVRLQDPSSPVSRAAAASPPKFIGGSAAGSRTDALRRMWNLKEIERRADIADEIDAMRRNENPGGTTGVEEAKASMEAGLNEFVANLPPSKSLEELEEEALELRSLSSINEKLVRWRTEARAQQEADIGRNVLVVVFGVFNQVARVIGLLTGKQAMLDDLEPIRYRGVMKKPVFSPEPPEKDMGELLSRLRRRWQEAQALPAPALPDAAARMAALIAEDDASEIRVLLNSLLDFPELYAALLGFARPQPGDAPFTPPLLQAAEQGAVQAVEVLLRAGSAGEGAAERARANGHEELAAFIERVEQERSGGEAAASEQ